MSPPSPWAPSPFVRLAFRVGRRATRRRRPQGSPPSARRAPPRSVRRAAWGRRSTAPSPLASVREQEGTVAHRRRRRSRRPDPRSPRPLLSPLRQALRASRRRPADSHHHQARRSSPRPLAPVSRLRRPGAARGRLPRPRPRPSASRPRPWRRRRPHPQPWRARRPRQPRLRRSWLSQTGPPRSRLRPTPRLSPRPPQRLRRRRTRTHRSAPAQPGTPTPTTGWTPRRTRRPREACTCTLHLHRRSSLSSR
jgi:hypothetical protein